MGDHQAHMARTKGDLFLAYLRSEQGAIGCSLTIGHDCNDPEVVIIYSEGGGRKNGTLGGIFQQRIPHTDRGPYKKDTPKASGRGLISKEDTGQSTWPA
ncbi:hypothetical protein MKX01_017288 [Papaver californicum]|nr:hypothetical protein MKX01_017288 [Papaver californicum]